MIYQNDDPANATDGEIVGADKTVNPNSNEKGRRQRVQNDFHQLRPFCLSAFCVEEYGFFRYLRGKGVVYLRFR